MSTHDDVAREAQHDYYDERPPPERPTADEIAPTPWRFDCRACNRPNFGYGSAPAMCRFCGLPR